MIVTDQIDDQRLRLADGRRLGYRIFGDPSGLPVLFLHGTPGSRLKFSIAHESGKRLELAIVAPDRWGYGLTEAPPMPALRGFAEDMTVLMDKLGHRRFAVGGISGGGPYAAAVAACLAERVTALALVSPVGPIADAGLGPSLPLLHRLCFTVLPRRPRTVSTALRAFRWSLTHTPRQRILGSFSEGLRPGTAGPNIDLSIFARPWQVDLAAITAPTRLWIGSKDSNVPLTAVRALAQRIPHCIVTELPNEGHLWVSVHHADVLAWIASAVRASDRG
jgi:pimeloyl-ACP methyl ester carboxylesterase